MSTLVYFAAGSICDDLDEFTCKNGQCVTCQSGQCVEPADLACDGIVDCNDESDEFDCTTQIGSEYDYSDEVTYDIETTTRRFASESASEYEYDEEGLYDPVINEVVPEYDAANDTSSAWYNK